MSHTRQELPPHYHQEGSEKKYEEEARQLEQEARNPLRATLDKLSMESIFGGQKRMLKEARALRQLAQDMKTARKALHRTVETASSEHYLKLKEEIQILENKLKTADQNDDVTQLALVRKKLELEHFIRGAEEDTLLAIARAAVDANLATNVTTALQEFHHLRQKSKQ